MSANSRYFDTIVIGAGMSGLACAARLFQHRARTGTVAVLEARDRIGGRINSVHVNGNRLDTGANWIHGVGTAENPNPLMEILPHKRYKQLSGIVSFRPGPDDGEAADSGPKSADRDPNDWKLISPTIRTKSFTPRKDLVIPSKYAGTIQEVMWGTISSLHEHAANTSPNEAKNTSVLSILKHIQRSENPFESIPSEYHSALAGMLQFVEPMEAANLCFLSSEKEEDMPGMSLLEYAIEDFDGDQVFLQDGYLAIVEEVARELIGAGCIQTGIEVEQITWETQPISIKTTGGTYTANNVVCTIPLGVLKQRQSFSLPDHTDLSKPALFTPALPRDKTEAISSLGFGTLDKVFLVYESPFWTEEPYISIFKRGLSRRPFSLDGLTIDENDKSEEPDSLVGFTNDLPGIAIDAEGDVSSGPRLLSMTNLHSLSGFPVLCAFVSCANARFVESLSDEKAGDLIQQNIAAWLGREPPKPTAVHVTRWANDPFSLGSYSHMITGLSEAKHRETFQEPITNRHGCTLSFAGEHTSKNHFATVHGALISGRREADEIINRQTET